MSKQYVTGLVSVSFRSSSPEQILSAMSEAGLTHIEWGSDIHAPFNDRARLTELARLQSELGISCSSYGTYFRLGETPIELLENYVDAAETLGTRILRLWCGTKSGADMTEGERAALLLECERAEEIARKRGATFCFECHRRTFTERIEDTYALMKKVNSPHIRTYWQPFEWLSVEENRESARARAPFCEHIHVFNWRGSEKLPLSEAIDTWRGYLSEFSGPRTLLLEFMPDGKLSTLAQEAEALRKIIEGAR